MNAEGMPYWLRRAFGLFGDWYALHYRLALCKTHGTGIKVSRPRHLVISGAGVEIGNYCRIDAAPDAEVHLSCWPYGGGASRDSESPETEVSIVLGDYCTLSPGARLIAAQRIEAGNSCMFAGNVYVTDADWHDRYHRVFPPGPNAPVVLGNNVWLAEQTIVLKGVQIGDNTIVGAGSVVVDSLPANVIAAGNPARIVGELDEAVTMTDRKALFEELDFLSFEQTFWKQRSAGNSFFRWVLGVIWPATRKSLARDL